MKEKPEQPFEVEPEEVPVEETTEDLKARLEAQTGEKIAMVIDNDERKRRKARADQAFKDFKAGQKRIF